MLALINPIVSVSSHAIKEVIKYDHDLKNYPNNQRIEVFVLDMGNKEYVGRPVSIVFALRLTDSIQNIRYEINSIYYQCLKESKLSNN